MTVFAYTYLLSPAGVQLYFGAVPLVWRVTRLSLQPGENGLEPFTAEQYRDAMLALLPPGAAWPKDPAAVLIRVLRALAAELASVDARAAQLMDEAVPGTATELLSDWERVAGLPDPCVTLAQSVAERRLALDSRLTSSGGQSRGFFYELALRLGYTVTIDEFASALEATAAGVVFTGDEWAHIWRVNVPVAVGITPFRVGSGAVGEPLRAWSNEAIECQFNRFKPAHTRLLFAYAP